MFRKEILSLKEWEWQSSNEHSHEQFGTLWGDHTWKCGISRQRGPDSSPERCHEHCHGISLPYFLRPRRKARKLREVLGTPAGCPWHTQQDKQGSTGRRPSQAFSIVYCRRTDRKGRFCWNTGRMSQKHLAFQGVFRNFMWISLMCLCCSPSLPPGWTLIPYGRILESENKAALQYHGRQYLVVHSSTFFLILIDSVNIWCILFFPVLKPLACGRQSRCLDWTYKLPGGQKFSIKISALSVGFPHRRPLNLIKRPQFINSPGVRFINHPAWSL